MSHGDAGPAGTGDVVLAHVDAVSSQQPLVEQADVVEQLGRGHAVTLLDAGYLDLGLGEVRIDAHAGGVARAAHVLEQGARAGVRSMGRELDAEASIFRAVPGLEQPQRFVERALADLAPVRPFLGMHPGEVDVVDAPTGIDPQAELGHCRQRQIRMDVGVVDQRRAEQHRLEGTQAGERDRLVRAHFVAMRHTRRVGRCEAHVFGNAADHCQNGVCVNVDEAGGRNLAAQIDGALGPADCLRIGSVRDRGDPTVPDDEHAVLDQGSVRVGGEDDATVDDEISRRLRRERHGGPPSSTGARGRTATMPEHGKQNGRTIPPGIEAAPASHRPWILAWRR